MLKISDVVSSKAEIRRSTPYLVKTFIHYIIAIPIGWSMAHYFCVEYGGTWPIISLFRGVKDLILEFGGLMVIIGTATTLYEWYRKRKN